MSSGGGGGQNTTTQVQQIPAYEQQYSQNNLNLAQALQSTPYPTYQGQLIAPFNASQNTAMADVQNNSAIANPSYSSAMGMQNSSATPFNSQIASQYMSPYVQSSLNPQIANLNNQLAGQQMQTNAAATQDAAFGDARNAVQTAQNNYYGDLAQNQLVGQGYNTAYNNALSGYQNQQGVMQSAGNNLGNLTTANQNAALTGANALYNTGAQQQNMTQQGLSSAYQQFQNQTNWPFQMLNVGESALANNPYTITNYQTLPNSNSLAQNLGAFTGAAGLVGGGSKNGLSGFSGSVGGS